MATNELTSQNICIFLMISRSTRYVTEWAWKKWWQVGGYAETLLFCSLLMFVQCGVCDTCLRKGCNFWVYQWIVFSFELISNTQAWRSKKTSLKAKSTWSLLVHQKNFHINWFFLRSEKLVQLQSWALPLPSEYLVVSNIFVSQIHWGCLLAISLGTSAHKYHCNPHMAGGGSFQVPSGKQRQR
jgi:hypothetical protein